MAGKFVNRWNGPFKITKSYSEVNYEIENMIDTRQKQTVVHVNRLKRFNNRAAISSPLTLSNNQPKPEITKAVPKGEEKSSSNSQLISTIKRGRGRPRKNVPQKINPNPSQNYPLSTSSIQRQVPRPTILRHIGVCFPFTADRDPFCYRYPDCVHQRLRRGTLIRDKEERPRFCDHNPEYRRRKIPNPTQSRYNLRPRH